MTHIENQTFGGPAGYFENTAFVNCRFRSRHLPAFHNCEFHDCSFGGGKVSQLTACRLYNTELTGCDFSNANVTLTETHACPASGCNWAGVSLILDCRFLGGLLLGEDANILLLFAMIPDTPLRQELFRRLTPAERSRAKALLKGEYRNVL